MRSQYSADKTGIEEDAVSVVIPGATLYLPLEDLVDFEKEKERLLKEQHVWRKNSRVLRECFPMRSS